VVHHQSEDYNLSTALRQTSSGFLTGWIFYLPMAVLGFPPQVFAVVALVDLLYQYWVHTQHIGKLGWFDRWFCSPSNHRVHHAVNDRYLDRNYGGMLIIWDRLFGSFVEEDDGEAIVYGTRAPLRSWNPLWANLEVWWGLAQDSWRARRWADKLRVWFKPPGWRPADVAARFPKPDFDLQRPRFDPPMSAPARHLAVLLFLLILTATSVFLWNAHALALPQRLAGASALLAGLALVGWLSERSARRR
jgi:alkylglycerol monooxygenase